MACTHADGKAACSKFEKKKVGKKCWKDFVKDYEPETVQFLTADVAEAKAVIKDRPVIQKVD